MFFFNITGNLLKKYILISVTKLYKIIYSLFKQNLYLKL